VLGLGGGAVTRADTRAALRAYADGGGAVVLIEISEATAAARLGAGEGRPMLEGDPMARWRELMAARLDHYREVATLRVSGDGSGSPRHLAREIHRRLALSAIHRP
jgi:shikimate kinase